MKNIYLMVSNSKKIMKKIILFVLICSLTCSTVFASGDGSVVNDVMNDLNGGEGVYGTIKEIMSVMLWAAFMIAIFKLMQIGMLFMMSAGKARSDAKSALIPWLVGAFVCVTFLTIGPVIIDLIAGNNQGGSIFDI